MLGWYRVNGRDLPWRSTTEPWPILVSEVMAQQTQVGRVAPKFEAFMAAYPDPASFAAATDLDVARIWSGLGYNRRGFRLREAARRIAAEGWPTTPSGLKRLPGVGTYTAAAVACFALGHRVAAIDTNLRRVLSRWVGKPLPDDELDEEAERMLPRADAAAWNQAIMDLGATLCRPRPRCGECPVHSWCDDPSVYIAPRPQGVFDGSTRQARGAVMRALLDGPRSREGVMTGTGMAADRVTVALDALVRDRLVVETDGRFAISAEEIGE